MSSRPAAREQTMRAVVIEANEVSPRVWRDFAEAHPHSSVAELLDSSRVITTVAGDVPPDQLFPAQAWMKWLDLNDRHITITLRYDWLTAYRRAHGAADPESLGLTRVEDDPDGSGFHHPDGSLILYNTRTDGKDDPSRVDYLEVAPSLLASFGAPAPDYMATPSFRI